MALGLSVIEFFDNTGQQMVHRWPETGSTDIKWGSQLVVQESQAAVFDRVQMGDAELARIYAYDAAIMSELGNFDAAIDDVEKSVGDGTQLRSAIAKLDALTAEFDRRFEGRKHLFDGLPTA